MTKAINPSKKIALFEQNAPEILQDLAGHARATLENHGIDGDKVKVIAVDIAASISDCWRGEQIYIPSNQGFKKRLRNEQIYQDFNGFNHNELAREYGVSVQQIYSIIKRIQAQKKQQRQAGKTQ